MASIYRRPETGFIWISYKSENGKRKRVNTGYRWDNIGERSQAKKVAKAKTLEELKCKPLNRQGGWDWIPDFIESRWGHKQNATLHLRRRYHERFRAFLTEMGIPSPVALRREHATAYLQWRQKKGNGRKGCGRNTALNEIKAIGTFMEEAVSRGLITSNPFRKLGMKQEEQEHKTPWTPEQVAIAIEEAEKIERFGWLHVALLLGRYQAIRIGQCRVPLVEVDLRRRIINYPGTIVKGGIVFSYGRFVAFSLDL